MGLNKNTALFVLVYGVLSTLLFMKSGSFLFIMLIWNVILASLPLCFMNQGLRADRRWKKMLLLLLWFFFFPNAIYMITDFIHLSNDRMIWSVPVDPYSGLDGTRYSMQIYQWGKLLLITLGAFYALLMGLESLSRFHDFMKERKGKITAAAMVGLVAFVASFGVFIGRFLRFNSWDILRPLTLVKEISDSLTEFTWWFTWVYGVFVLMAFILFRWFRGEGNK